MWIYRARSHKEISHALNTMVPTLLCEMNSVFKCRRKQASLIVGLWMRQEDCSTLWDPQQKMLDGRMWSVCNGGPQVCSVEQTEDAAVTQ